LKVFEDAHFVVVDIQRMNNWGCWRTGRHRTSATRKRFWEQTQVNRSLVTA